MDESDDHSNIAKIPTLEDLVKICDHLNKEGAQYMVIGGFAVIQQGYTRTTQDIDLLIRQDISNFKQVKSGLMFLPDHAVSEVEVDDFEKYVVIRVADEVVVDLMLKACGKTYEDLKSYVTTVKIEGVDIPFLNAEGLLLTKQSFRPKDQQDKQFLEQIIRNQKK